MRTKLSVVALSVVAAFALSACGQKEEPKPAATPATPIGKPEVVVKLGHVAPMTGPQAHLGKDNENGARLAIEELNAAGMEVGGAKVKFELLAEDDAADPKQGTVVAQKLVDAKVPRPAGERAVRWALKEGIPSPLFSPAMALGQMVRPLLPASLKAKVPPKQHAGEWPTRTHARKDRKSVV